MYLVLIVLFLATAYAECSAELVYNCTKTYIDTNADGLISADEIDTYIMDEPCGPPYVTGLTGADVVAECDADLDGYIGQDDLETYLSSHSPLLLQRACAECTVCYDVSLRP